MTVHTYENEDNPYENFWADAEVIHTYTRAQAIADGMLIDITETAREAGFKLHTVLTVAAWVECVEWTREDDDVYQDERGRLWDVVFVASIAARKYKDRDQITYTVVRVPNNTRGRLPRPVKLILHVGPGDEGEPVITIGLPGDF